MLKHELSEVVTAFRHAVKAGRKSVNLSNSHRLEQTDRILRWAHDKWDTGFEIQLHNWLDQVEAKEHTLNRSNRSSMRNNPLDT